MKRCPVQLDEATHRALKAYSEVTEIPVSRLLSRIVKDWMETTGAVTRSPDKVGECSGRE
jgi:hypothetical protein